MAVAEPRKDARPRAWRAGSPTQRPDGRLPGSLADFWLLQGADAEALEGLVAAAEERRFTAGDILFRQGEPTDGLYFLARGTVRVVTHGPRGEILLTTFGPGDCVGEMGVVDDAPRSATAAAGTFVVAYWVPADPFLDLLERSPIVGIKLLRLLGDRIRRVNVVLAD